MSVTWHRGPFPAAVGRTVYLSNFLSGKVIRIIANKGETFKDSIPSVTKGAIILISVPNNLKNIFVGFVEKKKKRLRTDYILYIYNMCMEIFQKAR